MNRIPVRPVVIAFLSLCLGVFAAAQEALPTIEEKTSSAEKMEGFFDFYWDEERGKIWLEIERIGEEFPLRQFAEQRPGIQPGGTRSRATGRRSGRALPPHRTSYPPGGTQPPLPGP